MIQELQQQVVEKLAKYTKGQIRGYGKAIAIGAVCLALGALL